MLTLRGGLKVVLDLNEPALLSAQDPESVGLALISPKGKVKQRWGLASNLEILNPDSNPLDSELGPLIFGAQHEDQTSSIFLDGIRYFVSKVVRGRRVADVMLVLFKADAEQQALTTATIHARSAEMFRRIGKALAMHQTLNELAVLAVHEIASSAGLAGVMLWARTHHDERLLLRAHVGVNKQGVGALESLEPHERLSCAAEMVAHRRKTLFITNVHENVMASNLEAKICYLRPGSAGIMPLIVGDRLVGVLELIGREGDKTFVENRDAFEAIAEHLSLALNTCLMFESMERMASFDPLTGVANHRALQEFLTTRVAESERTGGMIGVAMLDVDHFRAFNEEEGHDAGDFVLKEVSKAIKEAVRPYDLPARYGGEEFSIVMPGLDLEYALEVAERVRRRIEKIEYISANGRLRHVTASIGVASYPQTAREPAALFKAADLALFKAKRNGRNQVVGFEGVYEDGGASAADSEPDTNWLAQWQTSEDAQLSEQYFAFCKPYVDVVSERLALSKAQRHILEQLIRVYPTYRRLMQQGSPDAMRQMELANEFRPLLPSLLTLKERFDGSGTMKMTGVKIPLLSRVLSVFLAMAEERGRPLIEDPGRFDPEVVSIVADVQRAA